MKNITTHQMAKMIISELPECEQITLATEVLLMASDETHVELLLHNSHLVSRHAGESARYVHYDKPQVPVTATPALLPRDTVACRGTFPKGQPPLGAFIRANWEWVGDAAGVACLFGLLWVLLLVAEVME